MQASVLFQIGGSFSNCKYTGPTQNLVLVLTQKSTRYDKPEVPFSFNLI